MPAGVRKKIKRLSKIPLFKKSVDLKGRIVMVHGKKKIADNSKSFEDMDRRYRKWLSSQCQTKANNASVVVWINVFLFYAFSEIFQRNFFFHGWSVGGLQFGFLAVSAAIGTRIFLGRSGNSRYFRYTSFNRIWMVSSSLSSIVTSSRLYTAVFCVDSNWNQLFLNWIV